VSSSSLGPAGKGLLAPSSSMAAHLYLHKTIHFDRSDVQCEVTHARHRAPASTRTREQTSRVQVSAELLPLQQLGRSRPAASRPETGISVVSEVH